MESFWVHVFILGLSLFFYYLTNNDLHIISEVDTCPDCYGEDFCDYLFHNVSFSYNTFAKAFSNLFSVKNVYFATDGTTEYVVKRLAQANEFSHLSTTNRSELIDVLSNNHNSFSFCSASAVKLFLTKFNQSRFTNIWTIVNINIEPLILETFPKHLGWPVPKLYGYCGRTAIVEYGGITLNEVEYFDWLQRAYLALQILQAAELFSMGHKEFRLYLTDISPDNIVVDPATLKVTFVDLEHVILTEKMFGSGQHYTEHTDGEEYAFSTSDICVSQISDHNIYAVCKLILSPLAPYPMMLNGLLHSPPPLLDTIRLFEEIDLCVNSVNQSSRFAHSGNIVNILRNLLGQANF